MATTEPQKWSATLGASADVNSLPAVTPAGSGRASTSGLFPQVTQKPLDEGGIAPERADFNALFKYLGDYIYYVMQGGVFSYLSTYAYTAGNLAMFSGAVYECIAANGPGNVHAPTDTAYWRKLATLQDIPPAATVNDGRLTINVNGSQVATFTANQEGNSTANITIPDAPTVGDGTITVHASGTPIGSFTTNQGSNSIVNIPAASASAFGVVKIGSGITVTDGVISMNGSSYTGPQIFFATVDPTDDATIRAAGFWRCGCGATYWQGYGSGSAGGTWYIAYAPNGHTITEVDLATALCTVHAYAVAAGSGVDYPTHGTIVAWAYPPSPSGAQGVSQRQIPTAGMTQANEVAWPANPFA